MNPLPYAIPLALLLGGCAPKPPEPSPEADVEWAEVEIECQRMVKRRLLVADPIERRVEEHIRRDPRVQSARFAMVVARDWGPCGFSQVDPFGFAAVVTTHQPMTDAEIRQLLDDAARGADARIHSRWFDVVRDGNTWAVRHGTIDPTTKENPDLSAIRPE